MLTYTKYYKVKASNPSWSQVAQENGTNVHDLLRDNAQISTLRRGMTIKLPRMGPQKVPGNPGTPPKEYDVEAIQTTGPIRPRIPQMGAYPAASAFNPAGWLSKLTWFGGLSPGQGWDAYRPSLDTREELRVWDAWQNDPRRYIHPYSPYYNPRSATSAPPAPTGYTPPPSYGDIPQTSWGGPYDTTYSGFAAATTPAGFTRAISEGQFPAYVYRNVQLGLGVTDAEFQAAGYAKDSANNWIRQDATGSAPGNTGGSGAGGGYYGSGSAPIIYFNRGGGGRSAAGYSYPGYYGGSYSSRGTGNAATPSRIAQRISEGAGLITWRI